MRELFVERVIDKTTNFLDNNQRIKLKEILTVVIDGVKYQKSLNFSGKIDTYFVEYLEILNYYKELTGIDYEIRYQHEFNEQPETQEVFKTVLKNREYVAKKLARCLWYFMLLWYLIGLELNCQSHYM